MNLRERESAKLEDLRRYVRTEFKFAMRDLEISFWKAGPRDYDRMLLWLQLARQYHSEFATVAKMVVTHYRQLTKKTGDNLGLAIASITGPAAEAWIREELGRDQGGLAVPRFFPRRDPEQYQVQVAKHRLRTMHVEKAFRGSPGWQRPVPDPVELQLAKRGGSH